mgnify:CR=1 FL=1
MSLPTLAWRRASLEQVRAHWIGVRDAGRAAGSEVHYAEHWIRCVDRVLQRLPSEPT